MTAFFEALINIIINGHPEYLQGLISKYVLLVVVVALLASSVYIIWRLGGRAWALVYVALIPFLNWSFGVISEFPLIDPNETFEKGISLHPMTMVTGLVFVVRDFVQREMKQRVLVAMALAIGWSFFYAWPVIALASGLAFAISEMFDWLVFTFTKYRLSTRILISSAVAAPIDTTVFLYGADLAQQIYMGAEPGNTLHVANWIVFIIGKMIGAFIVSAAIRRQEDAGRISPHEL
ncbi:MAG: VUT family protein [Pseudomonadota bacterium]